MDVVQNRIRKDRFSFSFSKKEEGVYHAVERYIPHHLKSNVNIIKARDIVSGIYLEKCRFPEKFFKEINVMMISLDLKIMQKMSCPSRHVHGEGLTYSLPFSMKE